MTIGLLHEVWPALLLTVHKTKAPLTNSGIINSRRHSSCPISMALSAGNGKHQCKMTTKGIDWTLTSGQGFVWVRNIVVGGSSIGPVTIN